MGFFLDSVNVAAVAVMAAILVELSAEAIVEWRTLIIALLSYAWVFGFRKASPIWVVVIGSLLGYLLHLV
jgi:chromate transporter